MGFKVSLVDASLFFCFDQRGGLIVPVSTDDMAVASSLRKVIDEFKRELRGYVEITDVGELKWMLGFEVRRDRANRTIAINQKAYIEAMAKKFAQDDAKPVYTPMEPGIVLSRDQCPTDPISVPYQQACGHVLWPAIISRPDVQFAVGVLARFVQNPAPEHWTALKG